MHLLTDSSTCGVYLKIFFNGDCEMDVPNHLDVTWIAVPVFVDFRVYPLEVDQICPSETSVKSGRSDDITDSYLNFGDNAIPEIDLRDSL